MKRWLAISMLFLATMACAQTVIIQGFVLDPTGKAYQNGSGRAVLVPGNVQWLVNGTNPVPTPVIINALDSFGHFSISLTNTSLIQPTNLSPTWQFSFCSQTYSVQPLPVCFTMTPMALTSSQDISTQIQAQSALLPSVGGGLSDPGANGIVYRSGLNTTRIAVNADVIALWTGACNSSTVLFGDGHCASGGGGSGNPALPVNSFQWNSAGSFGGTIGMSYTAGTGGNPGQVNADNINNVVTVTSDYVFRACQTGCPTFTSNTGLTVGANTVTLTPVPIGINGANVGNWFEIVAASSDPTPINEFVQITGGTAVSGASSGTITFNAAYAHTVGYLLTSSTSGIQEAAQTLHSAVGPGVKLTLMPGTIYTCQTPIFLNVGSLDFDGQGASIENASFSSCLVIGGGVWGNGNNRETADIHDFNMLPNRPATWSVQPTGSITQGATSPITVTIPTCPAGFYAGIPNQLLWIAGTASGVPTTPYGYGEYVQTVTGGTCTPGLSNGTVVLAQATTGLSTFNAHDNGYTLSDDVGPYIEDTLSNNGHYHDIRFLSLTGKAGNLFNINGDQACGLDNIDAIGGTLTRADADFQGSAIFAPGPYGVNAAICYLGQNVNISNQASCVKWYSGNDFTWAGGVCQNYTMGGVILGIKRGGFGIFSLGLNVHFENGSTTPPLGTPLGDPAIMIVGGTPSNAPFINSTLGIQGIGSSTSAPYPLFANLGAQTATQYYYLVAHNNVTTGCTSGGDCVSVPVPIGAAVTTNPNTNPVPVSFYGWGSGVSSTALANPSCYDLLRVSSTSGVLNVGIPQAPTGTGNFLVASCVSPATICSIHNVCTITDNVASPTSYTPVTSVSSNKRYYPVAHFMPGFVAISGGQDVNETEFLTYQGSVTCLNTVHFFGPTYAGQMNQFQSTCPNTIAAVNYLSYPQTCLSSGGTCLNAGQGSVSMAAGATTVTVTTATVTPWSKFSVSEDATVGGLLGVTCNTTLGRTYMVTATVPGVSFTITASAAPTTNPACLDFAVQN